MLPFGQTRFTNEFVKLFHKNASLSNLIGMQKRTSLVFDLHVQVVEVGSPLTFYLPPLPLLFLLVHLPVLFTFHVVLFVISSRSSRRESRPRSNITIRRSRAIDRLIARRRPPDCKSRWDLSANKGRSLPFPSYWPWSWVKDCRINKELHFLFSKTYGKIDGIFRVCKFEWIVWIYFYFKIEYDALLDVSFVQFCYNLLRRTVQ